ncbi:MFS transporter [Streptomyces lydicamycinicus]|uniref:Putative major facilitator superfamily transporter n=1 Tax=Streptomyces lydicamycinicus TaxID=1546107 RepID=A0A0P4R2S2_9ACTN|nr:MFS transporter [Streptomyces lydicamycinicus]GAO07201.1 putative major facilitator superfamily transporter [Streptomyces lydicamycinicus]
MPLALLALAIGAFGIGTTEFAVMGLLPDMAAGFGVSIPLAGYATTLYALGVVVGAPLMTALGTRFTRKQMLMLLMGLFIVGNLLTGIAPNFGIMLAGRIVAAFTHGAFFGIGALVAADLVAPQKRATALSLMFSGLTVANVVGVPAGTMLSQHFDWRTTFYAITALGVIGLLGIVKLVPAQRAKAASPIGSELAVFRNPQVGLAMLMTILGFGGVFAAITYLASMMTEVTGFAPSSVIWLTAIFGLGMVGGNLVSGRFTDRAMMPMLYVSLTGLALSLAAFTFTAHDKIAATVTLALIGIFGFATVPPLQKRVMDQAASAPTLASAGNIAAFNFGNALAAWLGGIVISAGLGYTAPNWVGALMTVAALGVAIFASALERRQAGRGRMVAAGGPTGIADEPVPAAHG